MRMNEPREDVRSVSAPDMELTPKHGECPTSEASGGGGCRARKSDLMSNDEYRLTQNGIGLSDNGNYANQPYVGAMARARVELADKSLSASVDDRQYRPSRNNEPKCR